jgi:hypothetical protein
MPTVTISRGTRESADDPGRGLPARITGGAGGDGVYGPHPSGILTVPGKATFVFPLSPLTTKATGYAPDFSSLDRPGRSPLVYNTGRSLRTLTFDAIVRAPNDPMGQVSIEETYLRPLEVLVQDPSNVFFIYQMGFTERGGWRCNGCDITPNRRQHGTNLITRATVSFSFLENSVAYAATAVGPLTGK